MKWNVFLLLLVSLIIISCDVDGPSEPSDEYPPQPPQTLEAQAITDTEVSLTWRDMSDNEEGFEVEESIGSASDFFLVTTTAASIISENISELQTNQEYYFRVRAINQYGASEYSNNARVVTSEVPPTAPIELNAEIVSETQIRLTWRDLSGNEDGFEIFERINEDSSFSLLTQTDRNKETFLLTDKTPFSSYYYTVRANNQYGNSGFTDTVSVPAREISPATPTNLVAKSISDTYIRLTWNDESVIEDGYVIFESTFNDSTFNIIAQTEQDVDTLILRQKPPGIYYYRILAFNQFGQSDFSNTSCILFIKLINEFWGANDVCAIAFSPDSRFIATGSQRYGIKVWESYDGREQLIYILPARDIGSVTSLEYSPDGVYLAAGLREGTIKIWRSSDGDLVNTLDVEWNDSGVHSISFNPNSRNLVTGRYDRRIEIWDIIEGQVINSTSDGGNFVLFSPNGQNLASMSIPNHNITIWDASNFQQLQQVRSMSHRDVKAISYTHDGLFLVSFGTHINRGFRSIQFWSTSDGSLVNTINSGAGNVTLQSLSFNNNDQYLAFLLYGYQEIAILDVSSGVVVGRFSEPRYDFDILDMEFSPDGRYLAVGREGGYVQIWGRFR